ncbi:hypothetical protein FG386_000666 [Cryptosporidium ryanae]|uniref:uncharacterized protein n=1 Tax=Cryptosporidium ryanae TaxID=515981 RepID=UPI00351A48DA|nr:hypothetical protein FG386_000666 [Cryptosporidium ryanae]
MSDDSRALVTRSRVAEDGEIPNSGSSGSGSSSSKLDRGDEVNTAGGENERLIDEEGGVGGPDSSAALGSSESFGNRDATGKATDEVGREDGSRANKNLSEIRSNSGDVGSLGNTGKAAEAVGSAPNKLLEPFMLPSSSRLNPLVGSYLEKLSPTAFKGFQKRFFRLNITDNALLYWREEPTFKDQQPQGSINLSSVTAIHIEDALNFVIRTHGRDFCLKAFSPGDKDIWLESICMVVNSVARIETLREASAQCDFARHLLENSGGIQNYLSEALKTQRIAKWAKEDSAPLTFSLRGKKLFLNTKNIQNSLSKLWFDSTFGFKYYNNSSVAANSEGDANNRDSKVEHYSRSSIPRSSSFCTSSFSSVINTNQYRSEDFIGYSCRSLNTNNRKKSLSYFYGTFRGRGVRINKISNADFMGLEHSLASTPINNAITPVPPVLGGDVGPDLSNGHNTPRTARFNLPCNSGVLNNNIPFFMENSQQFEWSNLFQNAVRVRSHLDNVLFGTVYVEIGPVFGTSETATIVHINQSANALSSSSIGSNNNPSASSSCLDADSASGGANVNDNEAGNDNSGSGGSTDALAGHDGGPDSATADGGAADNSAATEGAGAKANGDDVDHNGGEMAGGNCNSGNPGVLINTIGGSGHAAGAIGGQGLSSSALVPLRKYFALLISSRPIANNEAFFPLPNNISLRPSSEGGSLLEPGTAENAVLGSSSKTGCGNSLGSAPSESKSPEQQALSSVLPFNIQLDCLYLFPPEYDDSCPTYAIELDNIQLSSKIREVQSGFQFKLQVPLENIFTYVFTGVDTPNLESSATGGADDVSSREAGLDRREASVSFVGRGGRFAADGEESRDREVAGDAGSTEDASGVANGSDANRQGKFCLGVDDAGSGAAEGARPDSSPVPNPGGPRCAEGVCEKHLGEGRPGGQPRQFQIVNLMEQFVPHQRGANRTTGADACVSAQDQQHPSGSNLSIGSQTEKVSMRVVSIFGPDAEIWREALIASCRARHAAREQRLRTLNDEVRAFDSVPRTLMEENACKLFYKTLYYILSGGRDRVSEDLSGIASIVDSKKSSGTASVFGIRNLEFRCSCACGSGGLAVISGGSFCKICLERKLVCHISSCFVTIPISRILHGLSVFNSTIRDLKQASIRMISSPRVDVLRFIHERYLLPVLSVVYECFNARSEFIKEREILSVLDFLVEIRVSYELCGIFDSSFKYLTICYAGLFAKKVIKPYFKSVFKLIYDTCHFGRTYRDKETGNLHTALISEVFGTIYSFVSFFSSLKLYNLSAEVRSVVFIVVQHAIMQFQMVLRDAVLHNLCKITDSDVESQRFFFRPAPGVVENGERPLGDYLLTFKELYMGEVGGTGETADLQLEYSSTVITTEVICGILNEIEQCIHKCDELDLLLERWTPFAILKFEQEFVKDKHYFCGYLFGTGNNGARNADICAGETGANTGSEAPVPPGGDVGGETDLSLGGTTNDHNLAVSGGNGGLHAPSAGLLDPGAPSGVALNKSYSSTQSVEVDLPGVSGAAAGGAGYLSGPPNNGPGAGSVSMTLASLTSVEVGAVNGAEGGEGLVVRESLIPGSQLGGVVTAVGMNGGGGNGVASSAGGVNIFDNVEGGSRHFMNTISEDCFGDLDMFIPRNLRNETRRFALLFSVSQMYLTVRTCKDWQRRLHEYFVGALKERHSESYRHLSSTTGGPRGGETPDSAASPQRGTRSKDGGLGRGTVEKSEDIVTSSEGRNDIGDNGKSRGEVNWANYFLSLDMSSLLKEHLRPQLRILKISLKKKLFGMVSKLVLEYTVRIYIESLLLFSVYYSSISDAASSVNGGSGSENQSQALTTANVGAVANEFDDLYVSENSKLIASKLLEDWDVFGHFFQDCISEEEVRECLIVLADLHDILISQKVTLYEKCREFQDKYRMFDVHSFLGMVSTLRFENKGHSSGHLFSQDGRNSVGGTSTVMNVGSNLSLELDKIQDAADGSYLTNPLNDSGGSNQNAKDYMQPAQNATASSFPSGNHIARTGVNWNRESEHCWTKQMNFLRSVGGLISQGGASSHGQQQHIHHNHSYFSSSDASCVGGNSGVSGGGADSNSGVFVPNSVLSSLNVIANNRNRRLGSLNLDAPKQPYLLVEHCTSLNQTFGGFGSAIGSTPPLAGAGSSATEEFVNSSGSGINVTEAIGGGGSSSFQSSSCSSSNLNLKRSFSLEIPSQTSGDEANERGIVASFLMGKVLIYSPSYLNIANGFSCVLGGVSGGLGLGTVPGSRLSDFALNMMMDKDERWWNGIYGYYSQVYIPSCLFGLAPNSNLDVRGSQSVLESRSDVSVISRFQKDAHPSRILNRTIFGKYIANYSCFLRPPITEKSAFDLLLDSDSSCHPSSFATGVGNYNLRVYFGPVKYRYSRPTTNDSEWKSGFLFIEDLTIVVYDSIYRLNILDMFPIRPSPDGRVTRICIDPQDLTRTGFIIFWGDRDSETLFCDANNASGGGVASSSSSSSASSGSSNSNLQKSSTGGVSSGASQSVSGIPADGEAGGNNSGSGSSNANGSAEPRVNFSQGSSSCSYFVDSKNFSVYFRAPSPKLAGILVSEIDDLVHKSKCIWGQNLSEALVKKRFCQYLNPFVISKH